ncbi:MAG: DUF2877 domain-containing protein [Firmicutes bacterium]|nr:DUF2877 domain-containing protein [Bacillota bacterium]
MILTVPAHLFDDETYHQTYALHSTYKHTQNYSSGRTLIALHDKSRLPSPMGIILDYEQTAFERLKKVLRKVEIDDEAITINSVRIGKSEVRLSQHDLARAVRRQRPLNHQEQKGLRQSIVNEIGQKAPSLHPELGRRIELLRASYLQGYEWDGALGALIGFGEGLTPSGDDIVCGLMAAFLYTGSEEFFTRTGELLLPIIGKKQATTEVSRSFLKLGSKGLFLEILVKVYERLCAQQPIGELIELIGALGHRSGTDYLRGILLGLELGGSEQ